MALYYTNILWLFGNSEQPLLLLIEMVIHNTLKDYVC
jgi:hypothetical protein